MRGLILRSVPFALLTLLILLLPWPVQARGGLLDGVPFPGVRSIAPGQGAAPTHFIIANQRAGIAMERNGQERMTGQAWGDYDQDGWEDLYLTDPAGPNLLYHNEGNGTFRLAGLEVIDPLAGLMSSGAVFADYDNDGFPDLYVLNRNQPNVLFHNEGGQRFVDVTAAAGVGDPYDGKTAAWGDYDRDGYLDLYVTNWSCYPDCARPSEGDPDALFRNNGDGTFTNVTRLLGINGLGAGFVASFTDYDNDGDLDIYLVNDIFITDRGNALWRNDGPGCDGWCFTEVASEAGADTKLMGMGLSTSDYDNDGDIDFYFSNAGPMVLLQNLGDGTFSDAAGEAGLDLGGQGVAWGSVSFDYDNDGLLDFYLALTDMLPDGSPVNPLFHNLGDGTFENIAGMSGVGHDGKTLGVAAADYDRDGWVDLVIGDFERGYTLFRNELWARSDNHRVSFRLVGGGPVNRDAVGARIYLTTSDGATQMQEVQTGSSLGSGNSLVLHFGLGQATIESVRVRWPDGMIQDFGPLQSDREYRIEYLSPDRRQPALPAWLPAGLVGILGLVLSAAGQGRAADPLAANARRSDPT